MAKGLTIPGGIRHLPVMSEFSRFIAWVLNSEAAHYHWIRSLSYLEYIGYRKMVKALDYGEMGQGTFHHLSDEIRHSHMLRDLANRVYEGRFQHLALDPSLISMAEAYFQDIDGAVHRWVKQFSGEENPFLCYLLTSYLIEKRAMEVYPNYYAALEESGAKVIMQKIILDERDHLNYLDKRLRSLPEKTAFDHSELTGYEAERFHRFLEEFRQFSLPCHSSGLS